MPQLEIRLVVALSDDMVEFKAATYLSDSGFGGGEGTRILESDTGLVGGTLFPRLQGLTNNGVRLLCNKVQNYERTKKR